MIEIDNIYKATNDGLDILLFYYPQAKDVVGTKNKFRARRDEKTPSALISKINNVWKITDFGDDGHALSPIDVCMKEEGITHFYEAVMFLARKFDVRDELNHSVNKPRIEKRHAKEDEKEGARP